MNVLQCKTLLIHIITKALTDHVKDRTSTSLLGDYSCRAILNHSELSPIENVSLSLSLLFCLLINKKDRNLRFRSEMFLNVSIAS